MSLNPGQASSRHPLLTLLIAAVLGTMSVPVTADHALNLREGNLMLHGFDPVAYFVDGTATPGSENHAAFHGGGRFLFASAANKQRFLRSPERFMPQFGGFCAYGVRHGKKFDIDPDAWEVVDGRLYVMLDRSTHALWKRDMRKNIAIANQTWRSIRDVPAPALE